MSERREKETVLIAQQLPYTCKIAPRFCEVPSIISEEIELPEGVRLSKDFDDTFEVVVRGRS